MACVILGVKVDQISLADATKKIGEYLTESGQNLVATVNPEFILAAQKNEAFRSCLSQASLATADGFGLVLASKLLCHQTLSRVTGVDLSRELLNGACPDAKIYLLGGSEGVAQDVRTKYLFRGIVGAESGGRLLADKWELENNESVIKRINDSGANIVLAAFGQVKQEMWLQNNFEKMPNVKVGIGIGGTLDYLSGKIKRAPAWLRAIGLEWLYRLLTEPKRIGRIWNATAVFGYLVIRNKFIDPRRS